MKASDKTLFITNTIGLILLSLAPFGSWLGSRASAAIVILTFAFMLIVFYDKGAERL